ncbi:hypothetical protein [Mycolicibacter heraklionensis]|uniref:Pyridine nucleotide-disulfide oxidoreductase n=1 Tax=Mycolicibacter heraklionensis TaxID=512402 RepID=A0AA91EXW3_9MYCO|nr:hypothetical protein [Mycolicibacter heraklionensis]OBK88662.1 hypothetical protein A5649_15645 [Mycolicibacter heraklionensis]OMC16504.1 hypothetical protein A5735_00870 [Mycolicibacter heraklionensis]
MDISADDVRRLLTAGETDTELVLIEGRIEIVPAAELASAAYRGALRVASRDEIVQRIGGRESVSARELEEQAEALNTAVRNLGA